MKHGSLFSGIGGFDLAADWAGWENIFQCENDDYCQKILTKNFPDVKKYQNIFEFDARKYNGTIDVISGGFPCQPFSQAGKRKGTDDERYLWPQMLRIIKEVRPTFVVGENVAGLLSMENGETLKRILSDLENEGYNNEIFLIPACSTGAWHRRDRLWIIGNAEGARNTPVANAIGINKNARIRTSGMDSAPKQNVRDTDGSRQQQGNEKMEGGPSKQLNGRRIQPGKNVSNADGAGPQGGIQDGKPDTKGREKSENGRITERGDRWDWNGKGIWAIEPGVGRVVNGVPRRVDRLKGLGNAIVPQVALEIFQAINKVVENDIDIV